MLGPFLELARVFIPVSEEHLSAAVEHAVHELARVDVARLESHDAALHSALFKQAGKLVAVQEFD